MSTFVKGKLKAARDALSKKEYEKAREAASGVLDYEPDNYHANVFLALALLELGQVEQSEQTYLNAIKASPDQPLALQGLSKLYEKTENWPKYIETIERLANIFAKTEDTTKCAENIQRIIEFRRDRGSRLEVADALSLLLPDSPFYSVLSSLPPPDATNPTSTSTFYVQSAVYNSLPILEEIVVIVEKEEEDTIKKEVEKRRTRLGAAGPEQIKKEVRREVLGVSRLPRFYQEVINHPDASDELRRLSESKLLEHKQRLLFSLPSSGDLAAQKTTLSAEVQDLVNGIVLLGIPNELAWTLFIEGKDAVTIDEYDFKILLQYVRLFPNSDLTKLLSAYLPHRGILLDDEDSDSDEHRNRNVQDAEDGEDYAALILDMFATIPNSILAHRIFAEVYEQDEDYENAIKVAESGLELVRREEQNRGIKLHRVRRAFNVILATSLVHFFPPKHHTRALRLTDDVLSEDPVNIRCLMGRGYILQFSKRWGDARAIFSQVADLLLEDMEDGLRAQEESAWCLAQSHDPETALRALKGVLNLLEPLEGRDADKARCWWRAGRCYWDIGDKDNREEAYRCFITSLKRFSTFAPAFTSLGIYYAEVSSPPDPQRASKCFQKAFELDPREAEAARRLAEGFAEEREWDLVEVVAKRTIEGEGGMGVSVAIARYLPLNAWAWKALGVVELNRQRYPQAIEAFQVALRTDSDDQLSWLRLGEAYSKAGRSAAALKALEKARELNPDDWVCLYFLGEVRRQMSQFQEAIDTFTDISTREPSELRVLISLGQTHLEFGRAQLAAAFKSRAEASFVSSVQVTMRLIDASPGFRRIAWKTAADAIYEISRISAYTDQDNVISTLQVVVPLVSEHPQDHLSDIIAKSPALMDTSDSAISRFALETAVAAYSYRQSLGSLDDTASGSAHYDLGMALCSFAKTISFGTVQEAARKESIRCLKEAISLDPVSNQYWNALGNALFITQPKTAQHAYIRALEIDSKSVQTWTNLGMFYLHHEDAELANEAFYKAQVLDPDFALAWVGQGLVASFNDHQPEARSLFEHAISLTSPVPEADIAFAKRLFDRLNLSTRQYEVSVDAFSPAFFVLDRFCRQRPQDATALHLFGLVCERVGHIELGTSVIGRAISLLEAAYEESEDPAVERQFTIAHTNMGRLRLALGDYDGALESYQVVLGLLTEATDETSALILAQAQFCSGLASFKLGLIDEALGFLETAVTTTSDNPKVRGHAVVLLAQTLWAINTEDGREAAKSQLLQSIDVDPENLTAINTLAGMGILTDDDNLIDAALSEILSLPVDQRHERDPERDVNYLLVQHHLGQGDATGALSVAQKAVLQEPSEWKGRGKLASLVLQLRDAQSARAILGSGNLADAEGLTVLRQSLSLQAVAAAESDPAVAQKLAEKAVMLAPWEKHNWQALAYARSYTT